MMLKRGLIILLAISFLLPAISFGQTKSDNVNAFVAGPNSTSEIVKRLDKYFEKARRDWNVPGLAIAIIKDNEVVLAKGYGVTDVKSPKKVDENTLFAIASNSKSMTAASIGILVDEGKLSWDDPVTKYLPYFQLYDPFVTQQMTVRDLLCHRTGLKTFSGDLIWYGSTHSREEVIKRAKYLEPAHGFRANYGYSNIMFLAAGQIVEVVSGKTWDEFIKEHFFDPLGMARTNSSVTKLDGMKNVATPHNDVEGTNIPIGYVNWDNISPAGGINSSVTDWAQYINLQLHDGTLKEKKYFSKAVSDEMRQSHTAKHISAGSARLWPSKQFSAYGLGWDLFNYQGYKIVNHGGGYDGMISQTGMIPELGVGFVILTNSISSLPYSLMFKVLDEFTLAEDKKDWSQVFLEYKRSGDVRSKKAAEKAEEDRAKDTKPSLDLEAYLGTYSGEMYGNAEVNLEDGKLIVQFVPTPLFRGELSHWHYDTFQIKLTKVPSLPPGTCRFILDEEGKVEEMKIDIPNPDFDFTELEFKKLK
jgi:CubicO group peptidase (beta-lactamase class C family)